MKRARRLLLLAALGPGCGAYAADFDPALPLVLNCYTCHGTDGRSPGSIPSINGKPVDYLRGKLLGFRAGTEPATVMGRIALGYSEAQLQAIADFLGTRP